MHDRPSSRRSRSLRWLWPLFAAVLLMPTIAIPTPLGPVPTAVGDDLSDAVQKQMALDKLIADQKKKLASIAAQQTALASQMATTQQNLSEVNQSMDDLQAEIDSAQFQVDQVQQSYDALVAHGQELQAEIADLNQKAQAKADELTSRQQLLAQRLVDAYKTGQTPLLTQILTSGSLNDALSDASYYLSLAAEDQALAEQIQRDQRDLTQMRTNVEKAQISVNELAGQVLVQKSQMDVDMAQLAAAKNALVALQKKVNGELAKQKAANDALAKNKQKLAAMLKSNGDASAKLAKEIEKLAAKYGGNGRIPSQYSGRLSWPMGGSISQEFGCTGWYGEPRVGSCAHFHQGIDIVAPCLTPVHAAGSGVILFVGYNPYDAPPRAWLVIIAHSSTLVTWYAHMTGKAPAGIKAGAQVYAGQVIGTENTTGHSSGCHLHWAVRVSGVFMNPRLFV